MRKALPLLILAGLLIVPGPDAWSQAKDLKWGTAAVGSSGHRALTTLAAVLNREMPNYRVAVLPLPGAILTMKG